MKNKVLLMILDGFGIGPHDRSNAIYSTPTPRWDKILATYPHSQLQASGENVGLPDGQMGNSEVGHLNIGAGRIVYQDLVKINKACQDGSILSNAEVQHAFSLAQQPGVNLHLMGLVSDGGVHSSLDHLLALCNVAEKYDLKDKTFIHCFMDGRDTDPKSGIHFLERLADHCNQHVGQIASIQGRFYAMDRDKRWERVKKAYDCLVKGEGYQTENLLQAVQESYNKGVTDEFIEPIVFTHRGRPITTIKENDVVIFFNFRNDRAKEITIALTQTDMPEQGMQTIPNLHYFCMVPYDSAFKGLHVLFPKENVTHTLGEVVSENGLKQLRIAETEKFAHVTFFFSGGREAPFENEDRILIPSPKVATYDLKPEMSIYEVTEALTKALDTQKYDSIILNFANGDMVGHTGVYEAIQKAVMAIDECVGNVVDCAKKNGYEVIIIADHGNADHAINEDGTPNTAHSLNPVPFVFISNESNVRLSNGVLADVAPSILKRLGIAQPKEMTGKNLIEVK